MIIGHILDFNYQLYRNLMNHNMSVHKNLPRNALVTFSVESDNKEIALKIISFIVEWAKIHIINIKSKANLNAYKNIDYYELVYMGTIFDTVKNLNVSTDTINNAKFVQRQYKRILIKHKGEFRKYENIKF